MDDYPDRTQRSSALPATNIGNVAVVRGSVIDVYFPQHLPHIRNLLRLSLIHILDKEARKQSSSVESFQVRRYMVAVD